MYAEVYPVGENDIVCFEGRVDGQRVGIVMGLLWQKPTKIFINDGRFTMLRSALVKLDD